jgi:hypothetical protein
MIFFGEPMLRHAVTQFIEHYHVERPHQGLGNVIPFPSETEPVKPRDGPIQCRERPQRIRGALCQIDQGGMHRTHDLFGGPMLRNAVTPYIEHYHAERPHQGISNVIPFPSESEPDKPRDGPI